MTTGRINQIAIDTVDTAVESPRTHESGWGKPPSSETLFRVLDLYSERTPGPWNQPLHTLKQHSQ